MTEDKTCPVPHRRRSEMHSSSQLGSISTGCWTCPISHQKITASDRLERAFSEIVEFRRAHNRLPSSTTREISEQPLGARLDGILANDEKIKALRHLDEFGLLEVPEVAGSIDELLDADPLGLLTDDTGSPGRIGTARPEEADTG